MQLAPTYTCRGIYSLLSQDLVNRDARQESQSPDQSFPPLSGACLRMVRIVELQPSRGELYGSRAKPKLKRTGGD